MVYETAAQKAVASKNTSNIQYVANEEDQNVQIPYLFTSHNQTDISESLLIAG